MDLQRKDYNVFFIFHFYGGEILLFRKDYIILPTKNQVDIITKIFVTKFFVIKKRH